MKNYYLERAAKSSRLAKEARRNHEKTVEELLRIRAATYLAKANGYNGAAP